MAARITHRQDLKVPHEPSHRLVKVRAVVLRRQLGRIHTAALAAFERVQALCAKIAEPSQRLMEKDEDGEVTSPYKETPSSPEPTPEETPSEPDNGQPDDTPDAPDDPTAEAEDGDGTSQGSKDENPQDGTQPQDSDSPSCTKCEGRLSFPCWYCIYCEGQPRRLIYSPRMLMWDPTLLDNLFLCDACDGEGAPELMRSSGKHTEDHHLIRCLAPEKEDNTLSSTELRLISLEDRLNGMQSRFDNMQSRFDDLGQDLTSRIGNMEQLLHRLAAAVTAGRSA